MGVRVKRCGEHTVAVADMHDGQLGEVISGPDKIMGSVVAACGDWLVQVGGSMGWSHRIHQNDDFRVRILPPGTELVIE